MLRLRDALVGGRGSGPAASQAAGWPRPRDRVAVAARLRDALRRSAAAERGREAVPGAAPASSDIGCGRGRCASAATGPGRPRRRPSPAPRRSSCRRRSNIAVGDDTPSGITTAVGRRWPGVAPRRVTDAADVRDGLAGAQDRPVWVVVRDPHRHGWMDALVAEIAHRRPDAVVIDTGWPGWAPPARVTHLVTHGASWASGEAVVELLAP